MPVRTELQARARHVGRLMKAGRGPLWAAITIAIVLVGGSVLAGLTWGWKHWLTGVAALLGILLVVAIEGSYQDEGNLVLRADEGPVWASGGYGRRWARCPPGSDGCVCDTVLASHA